MSRPATLYRVPKGATVLVAKRLTAADIAAGADPAYAEHGRLLDGTATMESEAILREEWDDAACAIYEDERSYPRKNATLELAFRSAADARNLAMGWHASATDQTGAAETDYTTRDTLANGDVILLPKPSDGSVTIVDSDVGPTAVVEGTNWEWIGTSRQAIRVIDIGILVQPWVITWASVDHTQVTPFEEMGTRRRLATLATNSEASCSQELSEWYDVVAETDLADILNVAPDVTDEQPVTIRFTARVDPDMPADPVAGKVGRIIR